jgi:hypothetical protein
MADPKLADILQQRPPQSPQGQPAGSFGSSLYQLLTGLFHGNKLADPFGAGSLAPPAWGDSGIGGMGDITNALARDRRRATLKQLYGAEDKHAQDEEWRRRYRDDPEFRRMEIERSDSDQAIRAGKMLPPKKPLPY